MIIFDCTDELGNKIPEGCSGCIFVDYDDQGGGGFEYTAYCALSKDEIGTFNQHDIGCYLNRNMKLTTCPLKEVNE